MLDDESNININAENINSITISKRKPTKTEQKATLTQGFNALGEVNIPAFTGQGAESGALQKDVYYGGTKQGDAYLEEIRGRISNAVDSGDYEAVRSFLKNAKLQNNLKGVLTEAYRDVNLTSFLERSFKRGLNFNSPLSSVNEFWQKSMPKETMSEEEFLNSPYYREGMIYDKTLNYSIQKDMAERMDDRAREQEAEQFRTGFQKVGYFFASLGAGVIADPITTIATAGVGTVSKTIGQAAAKAFVENATLGFGLGLANKIEFKPEGVDKSSGEVLKEALIMGVAGAGIGAIGKFGGNKWSNFSNGKFIDENFTNVNLQNRNLALEKINTGELSGKDLRIAVQNGVSLEDLLIQKEIKGHPKMSVANNVVDNTENIAVFLPQLNQQGLIKTDRRLLNLKNTLSPEDFTKTEEAIASGLLTVKQVVDGTKQGISLNTLIANATSKNIKKVSPNYNQLSQELKNDVLNLVNENVINFQEVEKVSKALLQGTSIQKIKEQSLINATQKKMRNTPSVVLKNGKIEFVKNALTNQYIENGNVEALAKLERDPAYLTSNQALNPNGVVIDLPTSIDISNYKMGFNKLNFNYKIVDYTELLYSNRPDGSINPNFNQAFQPRDRTNDATGLTIIRNNANNIDANRLILDFGSASSGAPIVKQDGTVIAGNGRMMSLELAYELDKANIYKSKLQSMFPQADFENIKNPILVREIADDLTDAQFIELAKKSNIPEVDSLSSLERIAFDSRILDDPNISTLYQGGDLNSAVNQNFYQAFFKEVAPNQLKTFIDPNSGNLTIDGITKLKNAILYSAYNKNDNFIKAVAVDNDSEVAKTLIASFKEVAPLIFKVKSLIQKGVIPQQFDISDNFSKAFNLVHVKDGNNIVKIDLPSLAYNLNESSIFWEKFTDPLTEAVLRGFFKDETNLQKLLTQKEMKEFFANYWDLASKQVDVEALGIGKNKTPLEVLTEAKGKEKKIYNVAPVEPEINKSTENISETKNIIKNAEREGEEMAKTIWQEIRTDVKQNYKTQTGAVKQNTEKLLKRLSEDEKLSLNLNEFERGQYSTEANVLNLALYGQTAGEWRQDFPNLAKAGKNIRDISSINELTILNKMQTMNAEMLAKEISLEQRLSTLVDFAEAERIKLVKDQPQGEFSINPFELENDYKIIDNIFEETIKKEYKKTIDDKFDLLKKLPDYLKCINGK
jgi:hypothetical protein